MSSSTSLNSPWAGPRRPRPAFLCAGALLLLAACHPSVAPSADAGGVRLIATWKGTADPALELAGFREALRAGQPAGVLSIGIDQAGNVVRLGPAADRPAPPEAGSARSPGCA